jgi:hypothetical protein
MNTATPAGAPADLAELRTAWQALGRALAHQNDLVLRQFRETKLERARSSLRRLHWGQATQIAFGVLCVLMGASVWLRHSHGAALIVCGVALHLYGIACIAGAAAVLVLAGRIDYAAPVLVIQTALARLSRLHLRTSLALGLVWWFLWIPFTLVVVDIAFGVDLYPYMTEAIQWMVAVCVAGFCATVALLGWARAAGSAALNDALRRTAMARSLQRANAEVEALAAFQAE